MAAREKREKREKLKAHRRAVGLSQRALAERIGVSVNSVRAWEQGKSAPYPRQHEPLRVALGISQAELARLLDPSVIELNGQPVPSWLNTYQSLVHGAGGLCEVDLYLIPGLLQTGAYAAAVERTSPLGLSESQIAERVDVRLARQEVLWRDPDPLQLVVVVPESVLREAVGGPAVMLDQLDHLAGMCRRRNVDIRILPPDGRGAFALNGFELLTRPGETAPFIAVADSVAGPHYAELPEAVARFRVAFDLLIHIALPPDESARRIEEIREIYR